MTKRKENVSWRKNDIAHKLIKELYQDGHVFDTFKFGVNCDMESFSYNKMVNLGKDSTGNDWSVALVGKIVKGWMVWAYQQLIVRKWSRGSYRLISLGVYE